MISPPRPGDVYPGRLPPVRVQWARWSLAARVAAVAVPAAIAGVIAAFNPAAGATIAVLFAGAGAATVVFVKNRTDRHNAAVDRGEIRVPADPHLELVALPDLPPGLVRRLDRIGYPAGSLATVSRFDGGWIVRRKDPRDVAAVVGADGGWARFDPRAVTDLWAVAEYRAGRGREPNH